MNCGFCHKSFSKGEHLRRHERRHTGSKPFVCEACGRSFARQDSLMRHARLHTRKEGETCTSPLLNGAAGVLTPESFQSLDAPSGMSGSLSCATPQAQTVPQSTIGADLHHLTPPAELDFELIWPDSEDLFQTIMSSDTINQWHMPLGDLAHLPPKDQAATYPSFGSPNSFDDRAPSIGTIPSGGNHQAVHNVSRMISSLSSSVTTAVEATTITSVFLDECLHMFFVRFVPTFPILHRATFVFRDCTHPLLLNAIAIGSLYLGPPDSVAKGEVLWHLAHTAVTTSWQTLITHRGPYDTCPGVQLAVTAILGQVYGVLSKNSTIRTTSQAFHTLGFFLARQCGMFDSEPYSMEDLPSSGAPAAEKQHQWRRWAAREIQQRAMLAHYVLDGLISQMSGEPSSVRHASNRIRLPSNEAVFEAGSADEWLLLVCSQQVDQTTFRSIFTLLFSPADDSRLLGYNFTAFSYRVLLEGLQSLISDCDEESEAAVGVPTKLEIRRALARVYESITQNLNLAREDRLEIFLRLHAICLDAVIGSSQLCRYVCSRCNVDQTIWTSGKGLKADFDLGAWVGTTDARRALLHAAAIQEIIEQLPRGRAHTIHMPSSLFAAATIYAVFALAGVVTVNLPGTVDWKDVLSINESIEDSMFAAGSDTIRWIRRAAATAGPGSGLGFGGKYTSRNLLYEFNSVQKLFGCLSTQWGVARDMGKVVDQWTILCR